MKPEFLIIIQTVVTASAMIAYIFTYRFLSEKVKTMEQTVVTMKSLVDSQTQLLQNVESYKKLYDPKDFENALFMKLDNQKLELEQEFGKQKTEIINTVIKNMTGRFAEANEDLLKITEELIQFPVQMILKQFPEKSQQSEKDEFIKQNYPYSADRLITFTNDIMNGKVVPKHQTQ